MKDMTFLSYLLVLYKASAYFKFSSSGEGLQLNIQNAKTRYLFRHEPPVLTGNVTVLQSEPDVVTVCKPASIPVSQVDCTFSLMLVSFTMFSYLICKILCINLTLVYG